MPLNHSYVFRGPELLGLIELDWLRNRMSACLFLTVDTEIEIDKMSQNEKSYNFSLKKLLLFFPFCLPF